LFNNLKITNIAILLNPKPQYFKEDSNMRHKFEQENSYY